MRTRILITGIICSIVLTICILEESTGSLSSVHQIQHASGLMSRHIRGPYVVLVSYSDLHEITDEENLSPVLREIIQKQVSPILEGENVECEFDLDFGCGIKLMANIPSRINTSNPATVLIVSPVALLALVVV